MSVCKGNREGLITSLASTMLVQLSQCNNQPNRASIEIWLRLSMERFEQDFERSVIIDTTLAGCNKIR